MCNDNNVNHNRRIRQYNQHLVIAKCIIGLQANKYRNQASAAKTHYSPRIDKSAERPDVSADLTGLESVIINNCPFSMLRASSLPGVTYNRRDDIID